MKRLFLLGVLTLLAPVFAASLRADTTVVFNEIMYHPASNETTLEWIELRNQMAVDVDVSGWSITGGMQYTFASNTIVRGGGFALLTLSPATMMSVTGSTNVLGPFTGRLSNGGDTLRLRNNSGRVVDEVSYGTDGDWPVAPDGSGVSLAKRNSDTASGPASNWTAANRLVERPERKTLCRQPGSSRLPEWFRIGISMKRAVRLHWMRQARITARWGAAWRMSARQWVGRLRSTEPATRR